MPLFIAIVLLLTGGVSVGAQQSLPGDTLYPVKVNINEEVRGWFALSESARAGFNADIAEERLKEAEELAAEAKLDAETRAMLQERFQEFADRVAERTSKFEDRDADVAARVSADFETALQVHERILTNISLSLNSETRADIEKLLHAIREEADDADDERERHETRVAGASDVQQAAEGRLQSAENKIAEVRKFIDRKAEALGADGTAQANARLAVAQDLITQGNAKLATSDYAAAFVLFSQAHSEAQAAKQLIEAKLHFEDENNKDENEDGDLDEEENLEDNDNGNENKDNEERGRSESSGHGRVEIDLDVDLDD